MMPFCSYLCFAISCLLYEYLFIDDWLVTWPINFLQPHWVETVPPRSRWFLGLMRMDLGFSRFLIVNILGLWAWLGLTVHYLQYGSAYREQCKDNSNFRTHCSQLLPHSNFVYDTSVWHTAMDQAGGSWVAFSTAPDDDGPRYFRLWFAGQILCNYFVYPQSSVWSISITTKNNCLKLLSESSHAQIP